MKVFIVKNKEAIAKMVGDQIINIVKTKSNACIGLATGSTPIPTYKYLIKDHENNDTDWSKVTTFNLDEYVGLKPTNKRSFHYVMYNNLFKFLNINNKNTHILQGIGDYIKYANNYDNLINQSGGIDLQLLGIGHNGHIGFNEPPADLNSESRVVNLTANTIKANSIHFDNQDEVPRLAVSMGIKTIMSSKKIILIANGASKADIMKTVIEGTSWYKCSCINYKITS